MPVEKVVVMHMMKNLIDVDFLFPVEPNTHRLEREKGEEPFSEKAIAWLHALSLILSSYPETRLHPDVATFAFFCRKANLMLLKKQYYPGNSLRTTLILESGILNGMSAITPLSASLPLVSSIRFPNLM